MSFVQKLCAAWKSRNSLVCVGLDPDPEKIPASLTGSDCLFQFNREVIDATAPWCSVFKPQIAYYAAVGAEDQLESTIRYIHQHYSEIPVILDAKRGDIGATATMYAREAFERYKADAVTVNPYMGGDTLQPFLSYEDKGVIVLCRTSNPGSSDIQQLESDGQSVAARVAKLAAAEWNIHGNTCLVVGATWPDELATVRKIVGDMPLLVPGVGAQGGDLEQVLRNGLDQEDCGLMINSSRGIIYASDGSDFAEAAGHAAETLCQQINQHRLEIRHNKTS